MRKVDESLPYEVYVNMFLVLNSIYLLVVALSLGFQCNIDREYSLFVCVWAVFVVCY